MKRLLISIAFVAACGATARAECPDGYARYDHSGGVLGCQRSIPGSSYRDYLILTELEAPPERAVQEMWSRLLRGIVSGLKRRDFIVREPRRLVFYDQIKTPVVSDRDYTVEAIRLPDEPNGTLRITFELRNDLGPPPAHKHTRIPALHAEWRCEPNGRGGTRLRYVSYSEPGGTVPAWMVRGAQAKHAMNDVLDLMRALAGQSAQR